MPVEIVEAPKLTFESTVPVLVTFAVNVKVPASWETFVGTFKRSREREAALTNEIANMIENNAVMMKVVFRTFILCCNFPITVVYKLLYTWVKRSVLV